MIRNTMRRTRWLALAAVTTMLLAACGGGGGGGGTAKSVGYSIVPPESHPTSDADASRFLAQASFGPTFNELKRLRSIGYSLWVNEELSKPHISHLAALDARATRDPEDIEEPHSDWVLNSFWKEAVSGEAQLRHRTAFALSQIFVISMNDGDVRRYPRGVASYMDMLARNAFGNYRTLLEEVTLHPMMGLFLSHLGNQKEDPETNRNPDENYAREVMQLFSIGLHELNLDGSPRTDGNGEPIETYSNADVTGMARIFTGLSWGGGPATRSRFKGWESHPQKDTLPMQGYADYHSSSEKIFLGTTVAAGGADALADVRQALDVLFNHPNVGPFIGRQLIQRLVTSNPSPAYIARVATAFNDNGNGVRGDMTAMIRAVLFDPEARDASQIVDPNWGKIREPVLRLAHWLRATGARSDSGDFLINRTDDTSSSIGQGPLYSPSVFNFYRPGYIPPNTPAGAANLFSPEMQITDETSVAGYLNTMRSAVKYGYGRGNPRDVRSDYVELLGFVHNPADLVERINLLFLHGQMSTELRSTIVAAIDSVNLNRSTASQIQDARMNRIRLALFLTLASPEYMTLK